MQKSQRLSTGTGAVLRASATHSEQKVMPTVPTAPSGPEERSRPCGAARVEVPRSASAASKTRASGTSNKTALGRIVSSTQTHFGAWERERASRGTGLRAENGRYVGDDLKERSIRELLALSAGVLRELRERQVVRTFNNPIGDIGEMLVALHYGGEQGSFSQKTWDVQVGDELLQFKALRRTGGRAHRNLSPIRSDDGYTAWSSPKTFGSRKRFGSRVESPTKCSSVDPT